MSETGTEEAVQETLEETLLDTTGAEEQEIVEETPVEGGVEETQPEPDSVDETVGSVPEKTKEQIEADRAHFQTKFQEERAKFKEVSDDLAQLQELYSSSEDTSKSAASERDNLGFDPARMSDDEIKEMLREDPQLQLQVLRAGVKQDIVDVLRAERANDVLKTEMESANRTLRKFISEQGIKPEEVAAARHEVETSSIKGRPAAIARAIIKELNNIKVQQHFDRLSKSTEVKVAEQVKRQKLTSQPGAAGRGLKEPSAEQALADAIAPKTTD